ncbi:MAG: TIGR04376 family protein [Thermostichales cyanobacterium DRC_bins_46]
MGLFDALGSFGQFLETKLDEFLRAHPELELQILADQVDQQYAEALNLLKNKQILELAEEIKTWHGRVEKAKQAKRPDLATQAQAVEDRLLQQGNTLWAAMKAAAQRQVDTRQLLQQIEGKREEIKRRQQELWRQQAQSTPEPWGSPRGDQQWQELERQFRELELQLELDELRRKR